MPAQRYSEGQWQARTLTAGSGAGGSRGGLQMWAELALTRRSIVVAAVALAAAHVGHHVILGTRGDGEEA